MFLLELQSLPRFSSCTQMSKLPSDQSRHIADDRPKPGWLCFVSSFSVEYDQGCDRYFGSPNQIQIQIRLVLLILTHTKIKYHYGKMGNFVSPNQIQIQIGLVLLVRPDTRDNTSQPCAFEAVRSRNLQLIALTTSTNARRKSELPPFLLPRLFKAAKTES